MTSTRRAPVMTDVARLAGVSYQTVWRVLNGHPGVRAGTRDRVRVAIAELGYHPNPAARALATGHARATPRSPVLGVVLPDASLPVPVALLAAVARAAARVGFALEVSHVTPGDGPSTVRAVQSLLDHGTAGIVLVAPVHPAPPGLDALTAGIPLVTLEGDPARPDRQVAVDHAAGAADATRYLLDAGHRTVWHVAGPVRSFPGAARRRGWQRALEAAGAEVPPPLEAVDWTTASGYWAGSALARIPEVTAVFAASDHLALGVLRALADHGRVVPEQVSVVGFDDVPESAYFFPPLTTVRPDLEAVTTTAISVLLEGITDRSATGPPPAVPPCLVIRDSTGPPRGADPLDLPLPGTQDPRLGPLTGRPARR